jgi:hypothetical protein
MFPGRSAARSDALQNRDRHDLSETGARFATTPSAEPRLVSDIN